MQIILPAASLVEQVVGKQQHKEGQTYRLMAYVIQCPVCDGVLLYHTLTCCMVLLTNEEATHLSAQQELIDNWFLVPEGHNDRKLCEQIRKTAQLFKPSAKTITGYTILTTTGCNARCFYCYEKGTTPVTMTPETATLGTSISLADGSTPAISNVKFTPSAANTYYAYVYTTEKYVAPTYLNQSAGTYDSSKTYYMKTANNVYYAVTVANAAAFNEHKAQLYIIDSTAPGNPGKYDVKVIKVQ